MNPPSGATRFLPAVSGVSFINHPSLGVVDYRIQEISDDPDQQVADTISLMRQYAQEDLQQVAVQADVSQAGVSDDPITDTWNYLHRGGTRGMSFVRDEIAAEPFAGEEYAVPGSWRPLVELIMRPRLLVTLGSPQGDCDCFATYGATHLLARGVPCAFVTVAADEKNPTLYTHVYLVAYPTTGPYAGGRIPMDLSHGPYPGWEVANKLGKRREWPVSGYGQQYLVAFAAALGLVAVGYLAKGIL